MAGRFAGQVKEYIAKVFPELAREPFSPAFRVPHDRELTSQFGVA